MFCNGLWNLVEKFFDLWKENSIAVTKVHGTYFNNVGVDVGVERNVVRDKSTS